MTATVALIKFFGRCSLKYMVFSHSFRFKVNSMPGPTSPALCGWVGLMYQSSGPQPLWHQGLVSWKTVFRRAGGWGGRCSGGKARDGQRWGRQMKLRSPAAHLLLCGPVPSRLRTGIGPWPGGWGPLFQRTLFVRRQGGGVWLLGPTQYLHAGLYLPCRSNFQGGLSAVFLVLSYSVGITFKYLELQCFPSLCRHGWRAGYLSSHPACFSSKQ